MENDDFHHQNVANTMENERFELKTVANTVEMAVSSSKMLQIAWKMHVFNVVSTSVCVCVRKSSGFCVYRWSFSRPKRWHSYLIRFSAATIRKHPHYSMRTTQNMPSSTQPVLVCCLRQANKIWVDGWNCMAWSATVLCFDIRIRSAFFFISTFFVWLQLDRCT